MKPIDMTKYFGPKLGARLNAIDERKLIRSSLKWTAIIWAVIAVIVVVERIAK